uniref:Uncharacterized protein n=1 Tax=Anguilla anguilla TaxID=7936 RepID=A0A0E9QR20_ANGAN
MLRFMNSLIFNSVPGNSFPCGHILYISALLLQP